MPIEPSTATDTVEDASYAISSHLSGTRFEDIPAASIAATKRHIFDTIGVMFAGSGQEAAASRVVDLLKNWGGVEESTVMGYGLRLPAVNAAFANAAMAHQYDFDDAHDEAVAHPTNGTLSAALAVAEAEGKVTGRELLRAVTLGDDLVSRIGLAVEGSLYDYAWLWPGVVGIWGAAAGASQILRLPLEQIQATFGLTLHQTGTTLQCQFSPGSDVRGLRDGFLTRNAVTSAYLASKGVRGDLDAFEGRFGFFNAFFDGHYDRNRLLGGLGGQYEVDHITIKPWPAAREMHATLEALLELKAKNAIASDDIDSVLLRVGDTNLRFCEPADQRRRPAVRMDALCSLPFSAGVAIVHGDIRLAAFSEEGMKDPRVLALADRVSWASDNQRSEDGTIEGGDVEVRLQDGRVLHNTVRHAQGHPDRALDDETVIRKFLDCASISHRPPEEASVRGFWETVQNLEHLSVDEFSATLRDLMSGAGKRDK